MEVYYDFELDEKLEKPKNPDNLVHKKLKEFVKSRYKVLEYEIDSRQSADNPAFVVLCMNEDGLATKPFNIAPDLLERLKNCITQDDFNYITDTLWYEILNEYRKN